jgi:hypothetical protein
VLDDAVRAGIHEALVPIVEPDVIRRFAFIAPNFKNLAVPVRSTHRLASDDDPFSCGCSHDRLRYTGYAGAAGL